MPKSLFLQVCFPGEKLDPTGCQCHHWTPVLLCHSIPSLHLSGMHFSHSFVLSLPLFSGPWCPGQSGGDVRFGCPRSIHPFWWNRIHWPPLCPVVSISQLLSGECQRSGTCEWRKNELTRTRGKNWSLSQTDKPWSQHYCRQIVIPSWNRVFIAMKCADIMWVSQSKQSDSKGDRVNKHVTLSLSRRHKKSNF